MVVSDYMTSNVTTLKEDDAKLLDAALLTRRTGKRHVPILSAQDGRVVGTMGGNPNQFVWPGSRGKKFL